MLSLPCFGTVFFRRLAALASLPLLALAASPAAAEDARPVEDASLVPTEHVRDPRLPTLFLVGDSTVKVGTAGQKGWGEEIGPFFDFSKINVVNRAIGGRSSRTFQSEGRWVKVLADLKPGDFVLIQFGHNDGGPVNDTHRARGTLRGTGEETEQIDNLITGRREVVHTYGWYLRKYVSDTRARGATPLLCSPVPRRIWEGDRIARTPDSYPAWAAAVAAVAAETQTAFLDLHETIALRYEAEGAAAVDAYFADERTHTTARGAQVSAGVVAELLRALPGKPFADYLR